MEKILIDNKYLFNFDNFDNPLKYGDLLLYQIGEIYCENGAVVSPHIHNDFIEISYILSGVGTFISNDKCQKVQEGDCFLSLPYEKHEILSDTYKPLRYYYIALSFENDTLYKNMMFSDEIVNRDPSKRIFNFNNDEIKHNFRNLISAFINQENYNELKFEMMVKVFCIDIYNALMQKQPEKYVSPRITNEENVYYMIVKYIDSHLLSIKNLNELAKVLNHNYSYLSRVFKKKFGQSLHDYYSMQKIDLAKKLIAEDTMKITEISSYLNYTSLYVFSRSFKSIVGMSPLTYKEHMINSKQEKKNKKV